MIDINNFDDIRPYHDSEVGPVLKQLVQQDFFEPLIKQIFPDQDPDTTKSLLLRINTIYDFQTKIIYSVLKKLLGKSSGQLTWSGFEKLKKQEAYLIISNHHDIVLDPSVLNVLLFELGLPTTKVAIGDNLFQKE